MTKSGSVYRVAIIAVLLLSTLLFVRLRRQFESVPKHEPMQNFPSQLDGFSAQEIPIDNEVRSVLGQGDFLSRVYRQNTGPTYVDLFIAYFPSQKSGDTIHSPKHCLPGSGWTFAESRRARMEVPGQQPITANEYVISKGQQKQLVLYWYQAHGRGVASEYWAKFYLISDAISMNRTDGALVRIVTPFMPGEDISAPRLRAADFARRILPDLNRFIPG